MSGVIIELCATNIILACIAFNVNWVFGELAAIRRVLERTPPVARGNHP